MSNRRLQLARPPRAFTLIELLVIIAIMAVLISILVPAINKAYRSSQRSSMQLQLNTIGVALDAYKQDYGSYPRPNPPARAYLGIFLIVPTGKSYLPTDKFNVSGGDILDKLGKPIAYHPRYGRPAASSGPLFGASGAAAYCQTGAGPNVDALKIALGDENKNNRIDTNEQLRFDGDYLLWSGGMDATFATPATRKDLLQSDDVFNFDEK